MKLKELIEKQAPLLTAVEIDELYSLMKKLFNGIKSYAATNREIVENIKHDNLKCPKCDSKNVVKNGTKNKTQRYKCNDCNKTFTVTSNNLTYHCKLTYEQIVSLLECMINKMSVPKTSNYCNIHKRTVYEFRIKVIEVLGNLNSSDILCGVVETDEKYLRVSLKGTGKASMPRESRKSGHQNLTRGISKEQACLLTVIDDKGNIFLKVVGVGKVTKKQLRENLDGRIKEGSILITDSEKAYIEYAKENKLNLKQIPSGKHKTKDGYDISRVNSLHNEIETWIRSFNGISTNHLQGYINWFRYQKLLIALVKMLKEHKKEMYEFILSQDSALTRKSVYGNLTFK